MPSFSFVHLLPQHPLTHRYKCCIQICICYSGLGLNINSENILSSILRCLKKQPPLPSPLGQTSMSRSPVTSLCVFKSSTFVMKNPCFFHHQVITTMTHLSQNACENWTMINKTRWGLLKSPVRFDNGKTFLVTAKQHSYS